MNDSELRDKFVDLLRSSLSSGTLCASDLADIYMELGSRRLVTLVREMISLEKGHLESKKTEVERNLLENKIGKNELENLSV